MGRRKCNIVRRYFEMCDDGTKLRCSINNCMAIISDHSTNLQKHLEVQHPDEFSIVMIEKQCNKRNESDVHNNTIEEHAKKAKLDLMNACVRMVTIHGRPFTLIDDDAFQDIINMIPSQTETINSHKIRDFIPERAISIRNEIKKEIKNKLISVKVDAATCMGRSFLGVNIQFMKDNKIHIRTLAVIQLYKSHTAEYLKEVIIQTCNEYDISTKQIYTVTIDNAANMLKVVRILNEELNEFDKNFDNMHEITGSEITEVLMNSNIHNNDNPNQNINNVFLSTNDFTIMTIRCAAHTLQLAVGDLLKQEGVSNIVEKAREVVKKLRTPLLKSTLLAAHAKSAILDCATRWHSTYDMLGRLFELKEYCEQIHVEGLKLLQAEWTTIMQLMNVLKPARFATKRLQSEQLLLGDLYEIWQRCIIDVKKEKTEYADIFINNLKKRETSLFQNDIFLAAICMDPRYNVILTNTQICVAKNYLLQTYHRIQQIRMENANTSTEESSHTTDNRSNDASEEDEFESLLKNAEVARSQTQLRQGVILCGIENELEDFLKEPRLQSSSNVLLYWNNKKSKSPELYKVAEAVLAIPPTQVSVERLFSGLKFILSPHRSKMSAQMINDILIIRLNYNKVVPN